MKSVILESIYFTFNQTWGENLESFLLSVYLILCFVHETYHVKDLISVCNWVKDKYKLQTLQQMLACMCLLEFIETRLVLKSDNSRINVFASK